MRHFKRLCAMLVLTLTLSLTALAGQIPCDGAAPPPPTTSQSVTMDGIAMSLLQSVLALF